MNYAVARPLCRSRKRRRVYPRTVRRIRDFRSGVVKNPRTSVFIAKSGRSVSVDVPTTIIASESTANQNRAGSQIKRSPGKLSSSRNYADSQFSISLRLRGGEGGGGEGGGTKGIQETVVLYESVLRRYQLPSLPPSSRCSRLGKILMKRSPEMSKSRNDFLLCKY